MQDRAIGNLPRMCVGEIERAAELATDPYQETDERSAFDFVVRCQRRSPEPVAAIRVDGALRYDLARRREKLGAGIGHDRISRAEKADAAFAYPYPNRAIIAHHFEFGADMFDDARARGDAQRVHARPRRDIEINSPALQRQLRGPGDIQAAPGGDSQRTPAGQRNEQRAPGCQSVSDSQGVAALESAVLEEPEANLEPVHSEPGHRANRCRLGWGPRYP